MSGTGSRHTRANSTDSRLYTAKDLEDLFKKKKLPPILTEEDTYHTPQKWHSPKISQSAPESPTPTTSATEEEGNNAKPSAAISGLTTANQTTVHASNTHNQDIQAPATAATTSTGQPPNPPQENTSNQTESKRVNMAIVYKDIKDLIPNYSGERKGLDEFIQTIDSLASQLTEDRDKKLFNLSVKTHLKDKAFNTIRHLQNPTWGEIKQALKDKLNPLDATSCYNALTHAKQISNESITDFAMKVETLLTNLNRSSTIDASETTRKYVQDGNEQLAKRAFENGILNFQLKTLIIAKNKKTLESAIREALDMDSTGEYKNTETKKSRTCNLCKKRGHLEHECFKKNAATKENNPEAEKTEKVCSFCKRKGHTVQECRTKNRSQSSGYRSQEAKAHVIATTDSDNDDDDAVTVEELESNHLN